MLLAPTGRAGVKPAFLAFGVAEQDGTLTCPVFLVQGRASRARTLTVRLYQHENDVRPRRLSVRLPALAEGLHEHITLEISNA